MINVMSDNGTDSCIPSTLFEKLRDAIVHATAVTNGMTALNFIKKDRLLLQSRKLKVQGNP